VNTPSAGTFGFAVNRFGLWQRLFIISAVLTLETLLLSALIQSAPLGSLGGAAKVVHDLQHWLFRFIIAYAVSVAILMYLRRGGALEAISASARAAPLRISWLLAHMLLIGIFSFLSAALYGGGPLPFAALAIGWHLCGLAAALALFAAMAPLSIWIGALRRTGSTTVNALLPAAGAMLAFKASQLLWVPAAAITFHLVQLVLQPLIPGLRSDAATLTLITRHFEVQIADVCSGLEGVGLMLAFCTAWLWYFRREYIFPRALIIVPAAMLFVFLLNALRIAALVLIGDAGYERIAVVGFHSQAGWIAFNVAAFCVAIVAKHSAWLNRESHEAGADTNAGTKADATAAYLMPFLAILAAGMIVRALSAGFDLWYPARLICAAIVLWTYRNSYRSVDWHFSWRGIALGAAVFVVWAGFARFFTTPAGIPQELANLPLAAKDAWIACRAAAAIITVPIAEELAYRGYLMRRMVSREFDTLPLAAVGTVALVTSAVAFGITHGSLWLPGIIAGLCYGLIAIKTGRIGESVAAHATTNALITVQVLAFGQWNLW
jgi:exosortase E/protease (VPEID-CTERM system)